MKITIDSEAASAETYSGILYRKQGIKGINDMLALTLDVIPYYKGAVLHYRPSGKLYTQHFNDHSIQINNLRFQFSRW